MGPISRLQPQVYETLAPHDLLLLLGADQLRMAIFNRVDPLPSGMRIAQIGERAWELGKNYPTEIAINANVKETLRALLPVLNAHIDAARKQTSARKLAALAVNNWTAKRDRARLDALRVAKVRPIDPDFLMLRLTEALPANAVVVEEGLTSTATLLKHLALRDAQGFYGLASGGIGFAMAGAVGISLALRDRPVVAVVGDGSAMYSIQALWTAAHLKLPITYVIANNRGYRILKERLKSLRGTEHFIGMDFVAPEIDFVQLAQAMGVPAERIADPAAVGPALSRAFAREGPSLLDIVVADGFGGPRA